MFKFIVNVKIREIIYRYRDLKEKNPSLNEDEVCQLVLKQRLSAHYNLYNLRNSDERTIQSYVNDIFKSKLTLRGVCLWFMEEEHKKYNLLYNSHDLDSWKKRIKELEERVDYFLNKIPGI